MLGCENEEYSADFSASRFSLSDRVNKPYAAAVEREIFFLHVRGEVTTDLIREIKTRVRSAGRNHKDYGSVIVTLPSQMQPLGSRSWRYDFGTMVVKGGGQLCFVDYMADDVDELEAERRYRAHFLSKCWDGR